MRAQIGPLWGGGSSETPKLYYVIYEQPLNQKAAPINLPLILIYRKFAISSLRTAFASGKLSLMLAVPKLDQNWISRFV